VSYKRDVRTKIRRMRVTSSKDYWNYINSLNNKTTIKDKNLDEFYDFFKNLNSNIVQDEEPANSKFPDVMFDHDLNDTITVDEISKVIKNLNLVKPQVSIMFVTSILM